MIRRRRPDGFFLITQTDHADLAAQIASHWGNKRFPVPKPHKAVVDAVEFHDVGWSLHDAEPTLNADRLPATYYEMPVEYYGRVWVASVAAAAGRGGPMAGLIVSWLFTLLARMSPNGQISEHASEALKQFSQAQRARQTEYCKALRLSSSLTHDEPTPVSDRDCRALYNFSVLRACDWISLLLCENVLKQPLVGRVSIDFRCGVETPVSASWADTSRLCLSPWPLDVSELSVTVPGRLVPANGYRGNKDLQRAYGLAETETIDLSLVPPKHTAIPSPNHTVISQNQPCDVLSPRRLFTGKEIG